MSAEIDPALLAAYSRGEITRREIGERTGQEIGFGPLLAQLHAHRLPLPQLRSNPPSPGIELIRRLAERAGHGRCDRGAREREPR